jgi:hypothetical protein
VGLLLLFTRLIVTHDKAGLVGNDAACKLSSAI